MSEKTAYGLQTRLDLSYEEAVERATEALKAEGFGILTEIDVKATMRKKLDVDFQKYIILGACNPHLAHQALQAERDLGLLLPCNVIVYEDEQAAGTVVSIVDPLLMMQVADNPALQPVAEEAYARLERVVQALSE